uniref:Uncharacterized protein n=1 Tax=Oryza brachyantha TaxID=4533 RepID=J3LG55_ORYBR
MEELKEAVFMGWRTMAPRSDDFPIEFYKSLGINAEEEDSWTAHGRTEPNLVDLTLALEGHAAAGFPGASDPARPVLRSGVLLELAGFVRAVREVPFPKPVPRRAGNPSCKAWESFAAAGKEPPLKHVPRWLPCFPEKREPEPKATNEGAAARWEARRRDEGEANVEEAVAVKPSGDGAGGRGLLPEKRGKVSFRLREGAKNRRLGLDRQCDGGLERLEEKRENSAAMVVRHGRAANHRPLGHGDGGGTELALSVPVVGLKTS